MHYKVVLLAALSYCLFAAEYFAGATRLDDLLNRANRGLFDADQKLFFGAKDQKLFYYQTAAPTSDPNLAAFSKDMEFTGWSSPIDPDRATLLALTYSNTHLWVNHTPMGKVSEMEHLKESRPLSGYSLNAKEALKRATPIVTASRVLGRFPLVPASDMETSSTNLFSTLERWFPEKEGYILRSAAKANKEMTAFFKAVEAGEQSEIDKRLHELRTLVSEGDRPHIHRFIKSQTGIDFSALMPELLAFRLTSEFEKKRTLLQNVWEDMETQGTKDNKLSDKDIRQSLADLFRDERVLIQIIDDLAASSIEQAYLTRMNKRADLSNPVDYMVLHASDILVDLEAATEIKGSYRDNVYKKARDRWIHDPSIVPLIGFTAARRCSETDAVSKLRPDDVVIAGSTFYKGERTTWGEVAFHSRCKYCRAMHAFTDKKGEHADIMNSVPLETDLLLPKLLFSTEHIAWPVNVDREYDPFDPSQRDEASPLMQYVKSDPALLRAYLSMDTSMTLREFVRSQYMIMLQMGNLIYQARFDTSRRFGSRHRPVLTRTNSGRLLPSQQQTSSHTEVYVAAFMQKAFQTADDARRKILHDVGEMQADLPVHPGILRPTKGQPQLSTWLQSIWRSGKHETMTLSKVISDFHRFPTNPVVVPWTPPVPQRSPTSPFESTSSVPPYGRQPNVPGSQQYGQPNPQGPSRADLLRAKVAQNFVPAEVQRVKDRLAQQPVRQRPYTIVKNVKPAIKEQAAVEDARGRVAADAHPSTMSANAVAPSRTEHLETSAMSPDPSNTRRLPLKVSDMSNRYARAIDAYDMRSLEGACPKVASGDSYLEEMARENAQKALEIERSLEAAREARAEALRRKQDLRKAEQWQSNSLGPEERAKSPTVSHRSLAGEASRDMPPMESMHADSARPAAEHALLIKGGHSLYLPVNGASTSWVPPSASTPSSSYGMAPPPRYLDNAIASTSQGLYPGMSESQQHYRPQQLQPSPSRHLLDRSAYDIAEQERLAFYKRSAERQLTNFAQASSIKREMGAHYQTPRYQIGQQAEPHRGDSSRYLIDKPALHRDVPSVAFRPAHNALLGSSPAPLLALPASRQVPVLARTPIEPARRLADHQSSTDSRGRLLVGFGRPVNTHTEERFSGVPAHRRIE